MAKTKKAKIRDTGVWLWIARDGEVRAGTHVPEGGIDIWLGFPALPPLTFSEADAIITTLCDLADGVAGDPRYFFRSDPRTQGDLLSLFRKAVQAEAAKR
jgi:hypothetical protein